LGDCLLWAAFWKLQKLPTFLGLPFSAVELTLGYKRVGLRFGRFFPKLIWGRCYDHNFLLFSTISAKNGVFSKTHVMIKILHNLALFWVKNANFFRRILWRKYLKSITSVPGHPGRRKVLDRHEWIISMNNWESQCVRSWHCKIVSGPSLSCRVARLGEFSLVEGVFTSGSSKSHRSSTNNWPSFFHGKIYVLIFDKNGLG
jgi:hypothetical protein